MNTVAVGNLRFTFNVDDSYKRQQGEPRPENVTLSDGTLLTYIGRSKMELASGRRARWLFHRGEYVVYGQWYGPGLQNQRLIIDASMDRGITTKLLHVTVGRRDRMPTWEELGLIKDAFFGDVDVMQVLPRREHYVNNSPFSLHLWSMPQPWDRL